jgi:hypothetical protein
MLRTLFALLLALAALPSRAATDADGDPQFPTRVYPGDFDTRKKDVALRIFRTATGFAAFAESSSSNAAGLVLWGRRLSATNTPPDGGAVRDAFLSDIIDVDEAGGRFLVVGESPTNLDGGVDAGVARLTSTLGFDTAFAQDGSVVLNFGGVDQERPLAAQLDGATLQGYVAVFGSNPGSTAGTLYLARIAANGAVDYFVPLAGSARNRATMLLDRQRRLVIASAELFNGECRIRVARYLLPADGLPQSDQTFAPQTGRVLHVDPFVSCEVPARVVERPDGRLLLLLWTSNELGQRSSKLMQITAGGMIDPAFASDTTSYEGRAVALQSDGRAIIVGSDGGNAFVERRRADGTPDATFSATGSETQFQFVQNGVSSVGSSFADVTIVDDRIILVGDGIVPNTASDYNMVVTAMRGSDRVFAGSFE